MARIWTTGGMGEAGPGSVQVLVRVRPPTGGEEGKTVRPPLRPSALLSAPPAPPRHPVIPLSPLVVAPLHTAGPG